jgi:hypothetical protein
MELENSTILIKKHFLVHKFHMLSFEICQMFIRNWKRSRLCVWREDGEAFVWGEVLFGVELLYEGEALKYEERQRLRECSTAEVNLFRFELVIVWSEASGMRGIPPN